MSTSQDGTSGTAPYRFEYYSLRRISAPEDEDRTIYVGQAPLSSILDLSVDKDVRAYLLEGKKRPQYNQVHRAIRDTLENNPDLFPLLNSGVTVVAEGSDVKDRDRVIFLQEPSIVDGAQTQGVTRDYYKHLETNEMSLPDPEPHVKFEIIVTDNSDLVAEISIARNFQSDVKPISIVGSRGVLDDLEKGLQREHPELVLRMSETDLPYPDSKIVPTERLIQVIAALVPEELWMRGTEFNKVYTYSQKTKCLREFQDIYNAANDPEHSQHEDYAKLYQFYVDVAGRAWTIYEKWKAHQSFIGLRIHAIKRDKTGRAVESVPDGIIFPIIASHSVFARRTDNGWTIDIPGIDDYLIRQAHGYYKEVANHKPHLMGKSKACYQGMLEISSLAKEMYDKTSDFAFA